MNCYICTTLLWRASPLVDISHLPKSLKFYLNVLDCTWGRQRPKTACARVRTGDLTEWGTPWTVLWYQCNNKREEQQVKASGGELVWCVWSRAASMLCCFRQCVAKVPFLHIARGFAILMKWSITHNIIDIIRGGYLGECPIMLQPCSKGATTHTSLHQFVRNLTSVWPIRLRVVGGWKASLSSQDVKESCHEDAFITGISIAHNGKKKKGKLNSGKKITLHIY